MGSVGHAAQRAGLPQRISSRNLKAMEVHFTPEQEARLSQIATNAGTDPERLVKDAALRLLEEEPTFAPPCGRASNRPTGASSSTQVSASTQVSVSRKQK